MPLCKVCNLFAVMSKNRLLYTDLSLIPLFVAISFTGVVLHVAPFTTHDEWHNWAVAHIVAGALFLIAGIIHIKQHWLWYKALVKGFRNKSHITIALSFLFLFEVVTGILLLTVVEGGGSNIGYWHYIIGLAMLIVGLWHILQRLKILTRWLE